MSRKLKIVGVSGSVRRPSRTHVLVEHLVTTLATGRDADTHLVELAEIAPRLVATLAREELPADVRAHIDAIESADLLVVGSPVYRASFTGLFKHLFDLVHHEALIDVPVLLAATGGSERHALVIDHQMRPLFSFFQARTLPVGVYASERDFEGYAVAGDALRERLALAVSRALPSIQQRSPLSHAGSFPTHSSAQAVTAAA